MLDLCAKIYGTEHPDYASATANLGLMYEQMGDLDRAEEHYSRALEIRQCCLGRTHPQYTENVRRLASLYEAKGETAKARELRTQTETSSGKG